MRSYLLAVSLAVTIFSGGVASAQSVPPNLSNLMPQYGGVKKTAQLLFYDQQFLTDCDSKFPDRKEAAAYFQAKGWQFLQSGDPNTAMKRFNQAWLLDSTNAGAYWGFGAVTGQRQQHDESLKYLLLSQRYDSTNKRLLVDIALSRLNRYSGNKQVTEVDQAIKELHLFLVDSMNTKQHVSAYANAYSHLAGAYTIKQDYAMAWKYVDLANQSVPRTVRDELWYKQLKRQSPRK